MSNKEQIAVNNDIYKVTDKTFELSNKNEWFSQEQFISSLNIPNTSSMDNLLPSELNSSVFDPVPLKALVNSIELNAKIIKNKTILVIDSNIGLIPLLCLKAGASKIYSVEPNNTHYQYQKRILNDNNQYINNKNRIILFNKDIYDLTTHDIPTEVDIIICQWMGTWLLQFSLIKEVIYARDTFLKPNGLILPSKARLYVATIENMSLRERKLNFWDNIYNINMTCLKQEGLSDPMLRKVSTKRINSDECCVYEIDMNTIIEDDLNFSNEYLVEIKQNNDHVSGLVSWFDIEFSSLSNKIKYTTSPYGTRTQWKQMSFYFDKDIPVNKGDVIYGSIASRVNDEWDEMGGLDVKISYHLYSKKNNTNENIKGIQLYKIK